MVQVLIKWITLLEDRKSSGLANKHISPLNDDDCGEEHSMASEFDNFSLWIRPFLTIWIFKILVIFVVPPDTESEEISRKETILHHNNTIADETSKGLDHTNLTICHWDESFVDKFVSEFISWITFHDIIFSLFIGQWDSWEQISTQIDTENGDGTQWEWNWEAHKDEERSNFWDIRCQGICDGLFQVIENKTTFFDTSDDWSKVVIQQDHISCLLGDIGTGNTHSNTNISFLEGWGIVNTITSDGDNLTLSLTTVNNNEFLLWWGTCKNDFRVIFKNVVNIFISAISQFTTINNSGIGFSGIDILDITSTLFCNIINSHVSFRDDSDGSGDGLGSNRMVTSDHDDFDTSRSAFGNGIWDGGTWRINHGHETDKSKSFSWEVHFVSIEVKSFREFSIIEVAVSETEDTFTHTSEFHIGIIEFSFVLFSHFLFFSIDHNLGTSVEDTFWGTFHNQKISGIIRNFMDRQLPFVGWVEWNFADFWTLGTDRFNITDHHFATFQESRFWSITSSLSLQDWTSFTSEEDSSVTESGDTAEVSPCDVILVVNISTGLIFGSIGFTDLIIEPHMGDGHTILGKGTGFIWANGWSWTQGFDSFQVLDQTILLCHSLGSQGQTDGDCGEETFWDVGNNDTDEEDNSFEPVITKDESKDEKSYTKEYSDTSNDMDEMFNFLCDWSVTRVNISGKGGNTSHNGVITTSDDDTTGRTFDTIGGEESNVSGFQDGGSGFFGITGLRFRFTSEGRVIDFHVGSLDDSKISWDSITTFDFDDITKDEFTGSESFLFTVTNAKGLLWDKIFEGFHNFVWFWFLVVWENTCKDDNSRQDNTKVEIIFNGIVIGSAFNTIGKETKDSTNPKKSGETTKKISAEFYPFWGGLWWSQFIVTVSFQALKWW